MLNSFLSLYIVSALHSDLDTISSNQGKYNILQDATSGFSEMIKNENKPIKDPLLISPIVGARGSIVTTVGSQDVLFEKNAHAQMSIASITKLMTILIILEENDLAETVKVSNNASSTEGSTMFLRAGEEITVENLLYGALINSANDSAVSLAEHNSGSVEKFVEKMNKRAKELGLNNTHFSNPIGLDDSNNYSSAYDIAKLANYLYQNKFIKKSATIKDMEVRSISGNYTHKLESTNDLLDSYLKIHGLKTGKTDAAGLCLVAIAENDSGEEIISVVLGSPARFEESKILIDWTFRAYKFN